MDASPLFRKGKGLKRKKEAEKGMHPSAALRVEEEWIAHCIHWQMIVIIHPLHGYWRLSVNYVDVLLYQGRKDADLRREPGWCHMLMLVYAHADETSCWNVQKITHDQTDACSPYTQTPLSKWERSNNRLTCDHDIDLEDSFSPSHITSVVFMWAE